MVVVREPRHERIGDSAKTAEPEWVAGEALEGAAPRSGMVHQPLALRCALGADTSVTGRLSFNEPTRIDGRLRGEVRASDLLVVGTDGVVEGTVRAPRLVVLGQIRGEVRGADQVEVGRGGYVHGIVETHSLIVREGGRLEGDCRIAPRSDKGPVTHPAAALTPDA